MAFPLGLWAWIVSAIPVLYRILSCKSIVRRDKLSCRLKNMRVVHVVWDNAVDMQDICAQILNGQYADKVWAEIFFRQAKTFLDTHADEISLLLAASHESNLLSEFVWQHLLQHLFAKAAKAHATRILIWLNLN